MKLTEREMEILKLLHYPNPIIAKKLILSIPTVKCHIHSIFNKFPFANNRTQLILTALQDKIIKLEDLK